MPLGSKPKKKKCFIDKNHATTFKVVCRSQRDPLIADERAPQHVLCAEIGKQKGNKERKEEQQKYGIYFDDDYNYLQHLEGEKEVIWQQVDKSNNVVGVEKRNPEEEKDKCKLRLPSSIFASHVEEKIGLMNRAATIRGPRPDLDPDIVAALDSDGDIDTEDELDDDFVIKANAEKGDADSDDDDYEGNDGKRDFGSDGSNCSEETSSFEGTMHSFADEETKSKLTNYSMSSSVVPRNEGLTLLDDRFEKFFEEFDKEEDDDEEPDPETTSDVFMERLFKDYESEQMDCKCTLDDYRSTLRIDGYKYPMENISEEDEIVTVVVEEPDKRWDCESILSTYSNLYNRPKLIKLPPKVKPIQLSRKTGLPVNDSGLTAAALKRLDAETFIPSEPSTVGLSVPKRDKEETAEEKRYRKRIVKEIQRERRAVKKANILVFKEEEKRKSKVMLNLQNNLKGVKLC